MDPACPSRRLPQPRRAPRTASAAPLLQEHTCPRRTPRRAAARQLSDRGPARPPASSSTARYLMCRPEHFTVSYTINPWMEPANPTDTAVAVAPVAGRSTTPTSRSATTCTSSTRSRACPTWSTRPTAASSSTASRTARSSASRSACPRARPFMDWFGAARLRHVAEPVEVNEGEGDFLLVGDMILAGTGFRSTGDSHRELGEVFGKEVVRLTLVDPRFYHLDTAISVLDPVEGPGRRPRRRTSPTSPARSTSAARRSSPSATPTPSTSPTRTAPCSASTRPATAATSSSRRARRASRRSCASAATTRCSSTCPSSSSAAAASSAARSSCAEPRR